MDLLDLLFDKNDGILRHEKMDRSNQPWPVDNGVSVLSPHTCLRGSALNLFMVWQLCNDGLLMVCLGFPH